MIVHQVFAVYQSPPSSFAVQGRMQTQRHLHLIFVARYVILLLQIGPQYHVHVHDLEVLPRPPVIWKKREKCGFFRCNIKTGQRVNDYDCLTSLRVRLSCGSSLALSSSRIFARSTSFDTSRSNLSSLSLAITSFFRVISIG